MPQYKAIDYLSKAVERRQGILNHMLLPVPHHLEYVDQFAHRGVIPDSLYRHPWKKAKPFDNLQGVQQTVENEVAALLKSVENAQTCKIKSVDVTHRKNNSLMSPANHMKRPYVGLPRRNLPVLGDRKKTERSSYYMPCGRRKQPLDIIEGDTPPIRKKLFRREHETDKKTVRQTTLIEDDNLPDLTISQKDGLFLDWNDLNEKGNNHLAIDSASSNHCQPPSLKVVDLTIDDSFECIEIDETDKTRKPQDRSTVEQTDVDTISVDINCGEQHVNANVDGVIQLQREKLMAFKLPELPMYDNGIKIQSMRITLTDLLSLLPFKPGDSDFKALKLNWSIDGPSNEVLSQQKPKTSEVVIDEPAQFIQCTVDNNLSNDCILKVGKDVLTSNSVAEEKELHFEEKLNPDETENPEIHTYVVEGKDVKKGGVVAPVMSEERYIRESDTNKESGEIVSENNDQSLQNRTVIAEVQQPKTEDTDRSEKKQPSKYDAVPEINSNMNAISETKVDYVSINKENFVVSSSIEKRSSNLLSETSGDDGQNVSVLESNLFNSMSHDSVNENNYYENTSGEMLHSDLEIHASFRKTADMTTTVITTSLNERTHIRNQASSSSPEMDIDRAPLIVDVNEVNPEVDTDTDNVTVIIPVTSTSDRSVNSAVLNVLEEILNNVCIDTDRCFLPDTHHPNSVEDSVDDSVDACVSSEGSSAIIDYTSWKSLVDNVSATEIIIGEHSDKQNVQMDKDVKSPYFDNLPVDNSNTEKLIISKNLKRIASQKILRQNSISSGNEQNDKSNTEKVILDNNSKDSKEDRTIIKIPMIVSNERSKMTSSVSVPSLNSLDLFQIMREGKDLKRKRSHTQASPNEDIPKVEKIDVPLETNFSHINVKHSAKNNDVSVRIDSVIDEEAATTCATYEKSNFTHKLCQNNFEVVNGKHNNLDRSGITNEICKEETAGNNKQNRATAALAASPSWNHSHKALISDDSRIIVKYKSLEEDADINPAEVWKNRNTDKKSGTEMVRVQRTKETPFDESVHANESLVLTPAATDLSSSKVEPPATPITPGCDTPLTPGGHHSRKDKYRLVDIIMPDDVKSTVAMMMTLAESFLNLLKGDNLMPSSHTVNELTSDITRFVVKQHEKTMKDASSQGPYIQTYKAAICLDILVNASECLLHCCLESALAVFESLQEKYQQFIGLTLDPVKRRLLFLQQELKSDLHPKIKKMCSFVMNWFIRKKKCIDNDPKILIIMKRDLPSLADMLLDCARKLSGIHPVCAPLVVNSENVLKILDKFNCVLVRGSQIGADFPWSHFSLVVEYEFVENSHWKAVCQRQHIRFLTLKTRVSFSCNSRDDTISNSGQGKVSDSSGFGSSKFICSHRVTDHGELLHLLESRYNMTLIERDYSKIFFDQKRKLHFSDIILDERTCVVLEQTGEICENYQIEPLVEKLIFLSLKFLTCWLVFYPKHITCRSNTSNYSFPASFNINMSKLHGAMRNFAKNKDFKLNVYYAANCEILASHISHVAEVTMKQSVVWDKSSWMKKPWLTDQLSQHEKFLISFPCLNSLSAQILLSSIPLLELSKMSPKQITSRCPWLSENVIVQLYNMMHKCLGLQLFENNEMQNDGRQINNMNYMSNDSGSSHGNSAPYEKDSFSEDSHVLLQSDDTFCASDTLNADASDHWPTTRVCHTSSKDLNPCDEQYCYSDKVSSLMLDDKISDGYDNNSDSHQELNEYERAFIENARLRKLTPLRVSENLSNIESDIDGPMSNLFSLKLDSDYVHHCGGISSAVVQSYNSEETQRSPVIDRHTKLMENLWMNICNDKIISRKHKDQIGALSTQQKRPKLNINAGTGNSNYDSHINSYQFTDISHNARKGIHQGNTNCNVESTRNISLDQLPFPTRDQTLPLQPKSIIDRHLQMRQQHVRKDQLATHMIPKIQRCFTESQRLPGIAPVTPRIRRPLAALQLAKQPPTDERAATAIPLSRDHLRTSSNWNLGPLLQPMVRDSPPMDIYSEDEQENDMGQTSIHTGNNAMSHYNNKFVFDASTRQRKLTVERMPGSIDGQTRLAFM